MEAYLYTPKDSCPVEFAGALIRLITKDGEFPRAAIDREWYGKTHNDIEVVNVGAGKLYSLYRALPSQAALSQAVFSLFPRLNSLEHRAYFKTLPDKRRITNDEFLENMDRMFETPDRLFYVQRTTSEGLNYRPRRRSEGRRSEDRLTAAEREHSRGLMPQS